MNDFKVGDRVEYFGPIQEKRGKTYTIKGFMSGTADVDGDPSFGPLLHNLRLITRTPDVITIDRADLPEVTDVGGSLHSGTSDYFTDPEFGAAKHRRLALQQLAVAEFLEAREKAAEEAKAAEKEAAEKLNKRRDELARKLYQSAHGFRDNYVNYDNRERMVRTAIDRIIELEDSRA